MIKHKNWTRNKVLFSSLVVLFLVVVTSISIRTFKTGTPVSISGEISVIGISGSSMLVDVVNTDETAYYLICNQGIKCPEIAPLSQPRPIQIDGIKNPKTIKVVFADGTEKIAHEFEVEDFTFLD